MPKGVSIGIVVNGKPASVQQGETVTELLHSLNLDPARVAVEVDERIIRQPEWDTTALSDGARVEIVQFVGGG